MALRSRRRTARTPSRKGKRSGCPALADRLRSPSRSASGGGAGDSLGVRGSAGFDASSVRCTRGFRRCPSSVGREAAGERAEVAGWPALAAVVVTVSLLGVAEAGAQQNPAVDQPGVTDKDISVGRSRDGLERPDRQHARGPPSTASRRTSSTSTRRRRGCTAASWCSPRSATTPGEQQARGAGARQPGQRVRRDAGVGRPVQRRRSAREGGIPTFGCDIHAEWGSEDNTPGPPNFFGQLGSFINFTSRGPDVPRSGWPRSSD